MSLDPIAALAWPAARFAEAAEALARRAGLPVKGGGRTDSAARGPASAAECGRRIQWAAGQIGLEAEPVIAPMADYANFLRGAGPALFYLPAADGPRLLLLLGCRGNRLRLLAPDLKVVSRPVETLRDVLCSRREARVAAELDALFDQAGISQRRRGKARAALLREHFAGIGESGCWLLRPPAAMPFWKQMLHARLPQRLTSVLLLFSLLYGVEIAAWTLIGKSALDGRLDGGWFSAWVLLILSMVLLELAGSWLNSTFTLDASRLLKQRLLAGALRMDLETVRRQGSGQLLGQVIESQALESLVLNGGLTVLVALLELAFAGWILSLGDGGLLHPLLLLGWTLTAAGLAWRYGRRLHAWTDERLHMTHGLIERMAGHRTCLAQESPEQREREQDCELNRFLETSAAMDRAAIPLAELLPRGWILLACLGLAPEFVGGGVSPASLAISLGGILLAGRTLGRMSGGTTALVRAGVAWRRIAPLFRAGARDEEQPSPPGLGGKPLEPSREDSSAAVLEAHGLDFRYRPGGERLLGIDELRIRRGDRILLEGPSGGGKSTLASLLVGLRQPDAGLLLLGGLDRHTLGNAWRERAVAAPQFHENHILSGSLAFNLLMGRGWPASDDDLAEAESLCRDLGLGDLLDRMPSGLMQIVGETGWQLSHGERSRVFLARALLQNAELTVLDESFAALDPQSLEQCLSVTLERAETLVLVAHP